MGYFSNGTEGNIFIEEFCSRCVHWTDEGADYGCPVWDAHLCYAYGAEGDAEKILNMLIRRVEVVGSDGISIPTNECLMFLEANDGTV